MADHQQYSQAYPVASVLLMIDCPPSQASKGEPSPAVSGNLNMGPGKPVWEEPSPADPGQPTVKALQPNGKLKMTYPQPLGVPSSIGPGQPIREVPSPADPGQPTVKALQPSGKLNMTPPQPLGVPSPIGPGQPIWEVPFPAYHRQPTVKAPLRAPSSRLSLVDSISAAYNQGFPGSPQQAGVLPSSSLPRPSEPPLDPGPLPHPVPSSQAQLQHVPYSQLPPPPVPSSQLPTPPALSSQLPTPPAPSSQPPMPPVPSSRPQPYPVPSSQPPQPSASQQPLQKLPRSALRHSSTSTSDLQDCLDLPRKLDRPGAQPPSAHLGDSPCTERLAVFEPRPGLRGEIGLTLLPTSHQCGATIVHQVSAMQVFCDTVSLTYVMKPEGGGHMHTLAQTERGGHMHTLGQTEKGGYMDSRIQTDRRGHEDALRQTDLGDHVDSLGPNPLLPMPPQGKMPNPSSPPLSRQAHETQTSREVGSLVLTLVHNRLPAESMVPPSRTPANNWPPATLIQAGASMGQTPGGLAPVKPWSPSSMSLKQLGRVAVKGSDLADFGNSSSKASSFSPIGAFTKPSKPQATASGCNGRVGGECGGGGGLMNVVGLCESLSPPPRGRKAKQGDQVVGSRSLSSVSNSFGFNIIPRSASPLSNTSSDSFQPGVSVEWFGTGVNSRLSSPISAVPHPT
eukprot:gene16315-22503_t